MKSRAGTIAFALLLALGASAACTQQPTAPDPAEPGSTAEELLGQSATSDTTAVAPVTERATYGPRKKGIGTE
ncbi:MAG: hypothetical protein JSV95_04245 [Gemmatimonadota bacterium]|jgi:hypothetical protein|nr:MAG: hypothetical protein JSV95_04245 [Gemmatimonadota bacterium]